MTIPPTIRCYSRNEIRADAAIHILGVLFAVNASLWLLAISPACPWW